MTKNCHCRKFDLATAIIKPAPHSYQEYVNEKLGYYCANCQGFHHVKQGEVAVVRGPVNARALLHAEVKKNGQQVITWSVGDQGSKERTQVDTVEFFPWPRRFPMTETEPLIHLTWKLLMSKVEIILDDTRNFDMETVRATVDRAKHEARGIAEVLAIQMKPFFESADDVVRAAVKYHKDPWYNVPGLGEHLWDPTKNPDGSDRVPISTPRSAPRAGVAKKRTAPKVDNTSTKKLTDKEREGIKEAVSSGMFTKEDVAAMFEVSMAEIEAAVS